MALIKFYRGDKAKYNEATHRDGLYFALDTKEIILNGNAFGYCAEDHKEIESVEYTAPSTVVLTYTNGESDTIELQVAEAGDSVDESKAGILDKEGIFKLSKIEDGAQVNIIEKVKVNGVDVTPNSDKEVDIDLSDINDTAARNKVVAGDSSVTVTEGSGSGEDAKPTEIAVKLKENGSLVLTDEGLDVDQAALTEYQGDSKAIEVSETDSDNKRTIGLKLNSHQGNILNATSDGLYATVQLKRIDVGEDEPTIAARYGLVGLQPDGTEINVGDVTIDLIKDKYLKNVELGVIPDGQPGAGNDALVFTFYLDDGSEAVRYVDVSTFLREAEAGNGIMFDDNKKYTIRISGECEKNSTAQPYLVVDETGLKIVGLNAEIEAVKNLAKQYQTEVEEKTEGFVRVAVSEEEDGHKKVVISEEDIASAAELEALKKRVEELEDKREMSDYWAEPDSEEFPEAEDSDWNEANPEDWAEISD